MRLRRSKGREKAAEMEAIRDAISEDMTEMSVSTTSAPADISNLLDDESLPGYFDGQESLEAMLISQGVDAKLIEKIVNNVEPKLVSSGTSLDRLIGDALHRVIRVDGRITTANKVMAFFGPAGVGKTTTIGKLAVTLTEAAGLKVGVAAFSGKKVKGHIELKAYAGSHEIPFRELSSDKPLGKQISKFFDAIPELDLLLIDMPGAARTDHAGINHLVELVDEVSGVERVLVLSASVDEIELGATAEAYKPIGYRRVALTGLDETASIAASLNAIWRNGKCFGFFGTGPMAPDEIEPASTRRMGQMLARIMH